MRVRVTFVVECRTLRFHHVPAKVRAFPVSMVFPNHHWVGFLQAVRGAGAIRWPGTLIWKLWRGSKKALRKRRGSSIPKFILERVRSEFAALDMQEVWDRNIREGNIPGRQSRELRERRCKNSIKQEYQE